jgi:iron(III) transport system substrate-binding protein
MKKSFVASLSILLIIVFWNGAVCAQMEPPAALIKAAKAEGELMFYSGMTEGQVKLQCETFQKKYGIKTTYLRSTSGALVQRFVTENAGKDNIADVFLVSSPTAFTMHPELFADLSPEEVPSIVNYPSKWWVGTKGVTIQTSPMVIQYNTDMVAPNEVPRTWKEVVDPKWKGKVMLTDPRTSVTYLGWLDQMEKNFGQEFVKKLVELDFKLTKSGASGAQMVAAGAFAVNFPAYASFSVQLKEKNAPIDARIMREPEVISQSTGGIAAKAPHPNAARLFLNYIMSEEGLRLVCAEFPVSSPGDLEGKFGCDGLQNPQLVDYGISAERENYLVNLLGLTIQ